MLNWMNEALQAYVDELYLSKSKLTVDAYNMDVSHFLLWLKEKGVKRISSLRSEHIVSYLGWQKGCGKSDSSINRYYMSIRSFCRFLRRSRRIADDLTLDIQAPKINLKAPRIPTKEEIAHILTQPDMQTEPGIRDKAILELLYSSGLRASELCDLHLEDFKNNCVVVKCGKGSKTRTVPVTEEAASSIETYLERYRGKSPGLLFQTVLGKQIRRQLLGDIVMQHAKNAGIEGVTPHTLRHACATHLLDEGADLRLIQEVLGHSSIASTQRYTHLSSNKIQSMFQKFHPRKKALEVAI